MSIDALVVSLAQNIGRALVLYDSELNVVAYSEHPGDVDPARRATILSRRGTARARQMMRLHGAAASVGPLVLPADEGVPERVVYPVRHDGFVLGYLAYVEPGATRDLPKPVRSALDDHAERIGSLLIVRDLDRSESRLRVQLLVTDLVSGDAGRRTDAARSLLADERLPAASDYTGVVMVLDRPDGQGSADHRATLESAIVALTRASRHPVVGAFSDGVAVAVAAGRGEKGSLPARLPQRELKDVRIGIGSPVRDLAAAALSVRQARIAARACLKDPRSYPHLARWDDLGLDRILLQLPLEDLTLDDLPTSVARLLDAAAGPDLAATVEAYLDCAGDAQATAARLTIHRSTFYYRLDRAREVMSADLHDGATRKDLHAGLRVARLAGLGPTVADSG